MLADEVTKVYEGMMIATGEEAWAVFGRMTVAELVATLRALAGNVRLQKFRRHPRAPKKPARKRKYNESHPHVATAKLLAERGTKQRLPKTKRKPTP